MSAFADLGSLAPLQRFVDHQFQAAACLNKGVHHDGQQLAAHRARLRAYQDDARGDQRARLST